MIYFVKRQSFAIETGYRSYIDICLSHTPRAVSMQHCNVCNVHCSRIVDQKDPIFLL